jgi:hypothetical protein
VTVLDHLQHQPRRHRQGCNQRNVDAAPDHDNRHRKAEDAQHRHVLQQRQHIRGGKKAGQGNREDGKKRGKNREHDSLLPDAPDSHAGFSYLFFCRRCSRALIANASDDGDARDDASSKNRKRPRPKNIPRKEKPRSATIRGS